MRCDHHDTFEVSLAYGSILRISLVVGGAPGRPSIQSDLTDERKYADFERSTCLWSSWGAKLAQHDSPIDSIWDTDLGLVTPI